MNSVSKMEEDSEKDTQGSGEKKLSLWLEEENKLYTWQGYHGDLGLSCPPSLATTKLQQVALGGDHSVFLTEDGRVLSMGRNSLGQLGLGHTETCTEAQCVEALKGLVVVQVACGIHHSGAVTENGEVLCWGDNKQRQCGVDQPDAVTSPAKVALVETGRKCEHGVSLGDSPVMAVQLTLGAGHSLALSDTGQVWTWGSGIPVEASGVTTSWSPRQVEAPWKGSVLSLCCGHNHVLALVKRTTDSRNSSPDHRRSRVSSMEMYGRYIPSRCSKCKEELYTCTEMQDMCIIHGNHVCPPNADTSHDLSLDQTFNSSLGGGETSLEESEELKDSVTDSGSKSSCEEPAVGGDSDSRESSVGKAEAAEGDAGELSHGGMEKGDISPSGPEADAAGAEMGSSPDKSPEELQSKESEVSTRLDSENLDHAQSDPNGNVHRKLPAPSDSRTPESDSSQVSPTKEQAVTSKNGESPSRGLDSSSLQEKMEEGENKKEVIWRRKSSQDEEEERERERSQVGSPASDVWTDGTTPPKVQRSTSFLDETAARKYLARQFDQDEDAGPSGSTTATQEKPSKPEVKAAPTDGAKRDAGKPEEKASPKPAADSAAEEGGGKGKPPPGFMLPYSAMMQTVKSANRALVNIGASVADKFNFVTSQVLSASPEDPIPPSGTETVSSSVTSLDGSTPLKMSPAVSQEVSPKTPDRSMAALLPQSPTDSVNVLRRQSTTLHTDSPAGGVGVELGVGLETEVWAWGQNGKGQLGVGDALERQKPVCLKIMNSKHVVKLAAGATHSLALTANSHVYAWGNNAHGQLGHNESQATPNRLKFMKGCSVWDVAAGDNHSLFLADSSGMEPDIFFCGRHPLEGVYAPVHKTKVPTALAAVKKMGWVRSVMSGGDNCACLVEGKVRPVMSVVFQFASSERGFYQHLNRVITAFLKPLKKTAYYTTTDVFPYSRCLKAMCAGFSVLTRKVGQCLVNLTEQIRERGNVLEADIFLQAAALVDEFSKYSCLYSDALAIGTFPEATKGAANFFEMLETIIPDLVQSKSFNKKNHAGAFQQVMSYPFQRVAEYMHWIGKIIECLPQDSEEVASLKKALRYWESLRTSTSTDHNIASRTQAFWDTVSIKISDSLRRPKRRLLRESKTHPLVLSSAGRFSSHLFLLFNDVFVHVQSTAVLIFPLETVWVEAGNVEGESQPILITTPEDALLVIASSPAEKAEWLMALNSAINKVLSGQRAASERRKSTDRLTPRIMRHALHKFYRPGVYHDATYSGSWANGKVHGYGEMLWSDGRKYVGSFSQGLQEGWGVYSEPREGGLQEVHEGNWKDGKLSGMATIKYANGDSYHGYFKDGQRFGHGVLRQGRHTASSASVYVGEWLHDRRHGYGIHDDVLKGEKYMGQWLEDVRCGQGVLVTLDGMYFEGHFSNNRMAGQGLMLTDDDCCYEGEFQGITQLQGRGTLTLSNGDRIEGSFSGSLDEGLKVTGTFFKCPYTGSPEKRAVATRPKSKQFGRLSVPAERKWEDLFRHCCAMLGYQGGGMPDCQRAWEVVAIAVTSGRKHLKELKERSPNKAKACAVGLEELETIPPHNQPVLTPSVYMAIHQYLLKAFEMNCHPLGELMDCLVDVFRATYVGIGAHPRLLPHAVKEVQSYIVRLYAVIRILFPELPERTSAVQIFPEESGDTSPSSSPLSAVFPPSMNAQEDSSMVISAAGLLSPILLPKVYPPLFDLYALHYDQEDDRYWERVVRLNRQGDMALMSFLGVPQKYWQMEEMLKQCQSENLSSLRDQCYASAVDKLQHISSALSPMEKMMVVERAFLEITVTVQSALGVQHQWCMDDLFPIFQFVVVRAKIRHLGAEVALVEDLMEKHLEHGELGLMVTTLKACYYQILNEKMPNH